MTDIKIFISELVREKDKLDMPVFLNFLRDELDRKGIKLTINRSSDLHLVPFNMSNIIGVELDLFDHDKKKDAEIEKYKEAFESAKRERDKEVCEYRNKIDKLTAENAELHFQIQAINMYPDESIREPIKMADWIVHHFKQGEEYAIYQRDMDGKLQYIEIDGELVPVQTGEYGKHREVREIADYLLAYCKYHSEG